jgi:hypothetical protein
MYEPEDLIEYLGWNTSFHDLVKAGWEIKVKQKYINPINEYYHSACAHDKIYIRHKKDKLLGRLVLGVSGCQIENNTKIWKLDFLIQEHNLRTKPSRILSVEQLTEKDIGILLENILIVQSRRKYVRNRNIQRSGIRRRVG